MLAHCVNEALLQVAGVVKRCLAHVPASVPKFGSQSDLGPDRLAATYLEIQVAPLSQRGRAMLSVG